MTGARSAEPIPEIAEPLAEQVARLEQIAGRRVRFVPTTDNYDGGYPYYRRHGDAYAYLVDERGHTLRTTVLATADEVVALAMADIVTTLAGEHELDHRRAGEDSRRRWFALMVQWLTALRAEWGEAERARQEEILRRSPFRDEP